MEKEARNAEENTPRFETETGPEKEEQGDTIRILDAETINKIAAGEVIERPASVVKELVDNSIDAGATEIRVEVKKGGKESILVRDNGCGMSRKDALIAFKKHATSKLRKIEDLESIFTMGFRGEALSSITSVASVEILTRKKSELAGTRMVVQGGKVEEVSVAGTAPGTLVHVRDLFYNTPARRKYLKNNRTELAHITDMVMNLALANPKISFTLAGDGKVLLRNPGSKDLFNAVVNLLGAENARALLPLKYHSDLVDIEGFISKPELTRSSTDQLFIFINTRPVKSKTITSAVRLGYYTKIPKGRFPVAVLSFNLDPGCVDINVHPRKAEVRFSQEKELETAVSEAVKEALRTEDLVPKIKNQKKKIVQISDYARSPEDRTEPGESLGATEKGSGTGGREILREEAEKYTYPAKDTERRLKRSERLLAFGAGMEPESGKKIEKEIKSETGNDTKKEIKKENRKENEKPEPAQKNRENAKKTGNANPLEALRVIGQVGNLYILAEKEGALVIIDQHAAHERILYEQIRKVKKSRVQELITPVTIELTPKEKVLMEEYIPCLEEYGFGISEFGDSTYVVTFVPDIFGRLEDPALIHDMISDLLSGGRVKKDTGILEKVCKTLACRAAIKGGAACNIRQMENLIEQLKQAENPYSCPHGRPTVISFTREELDRMFARIQ